MGVIREIAVGKVDTQKWVRESFTVSPDCRRFAYVQEIDTLAAVVVNGKVEQPYGRIGQPCFSPNSRKYAYPGLSGGQWTMVVDGLAGNLYPDAEDPVFSPDSQHLAYVVRAGGKSKIVIDGNEHVAVGEPFGNGTPRLYGHVAIRSDFVGTDTTDPWHGPLHFSPDGRRLAYPSSINGKPHVVVDGDQGKPYDGIAVLSVQFSPDSQRLGYMAVRNQKKVVVVDNRELLCDNVTQDWIRFSPDSRRFGYCAQTKGAWHTIIDRKEGPAYAYCSSLTFSPDSRRVGYTARKDSAWSVIVDDRAGAAYESCGVPIFSNDSRRVAYTAKKNDGWVVVVDGQESKPYEALGIPIFSPDSRQVLWAATRGKEHFLVTDGEEGEPWDAVLNPVFGPCPSPRQTRYSIRILPGGGLGVQGQEANMAYVVVSEDVQFVIVNGKASKPYPGLVGIGGATIIFDSPNTLHYMFIAEGTIYVAEEQIP